MNNLIYLKNNELNNKYNIENTLTTAVEKIFTVKDSKLIVLILNFLFNINLNLDSKITYLEENKIDDFNFKFNSKPFLTFSVEDIVFRIESSINILNNCDIKILKYPNHNNSSNLININIPIPCVILFRENNCIQDDRALQINYLEHSFIYKYPVIKLFNYTLEELVENNLIILLPLYILSSRENIIKLKRDPFIKSNNKELKELEELHAHTYKMINTYLEKLYLKNKICIEDFNLLTSSCSDLYSI